jgi:FMN-dependent NADH-azoreductase
MTNVLMLLSSPRGQASLSTKVARALADRLSSEPGATLKVRDLASDALPHIDPAYVVGRMLPPEQRTPAQAEAAALAETLVDELKAADVLVIAASMINFALSSTLKAWIDHVVWPGRTMITTPNGPKGLIGGKKVYVVVASGGVYSSGPMVANDMLVPYLKQILGFIGITDIETIRAEAQSLGPEAAEKGAAAAMSQVVSLFPVSNGLAGIAPTVQRVSGV